MAAAAAGQCLRVIGVGFGGHGGGGAGTNVGGRCEHVTEPRMVWTGRVVVGRCLWLGAGKGFGLPPRAGVDSKELFKLCHWRKDTVFVVEAGN